MLLLAGLDVVKYDPEYIQFRSMMEFMVIVRVKRILHPDNLSLQPNLVIVSKLKGFLTECF